MSETDPSALISSERIPLSGDYGHFSSALYVREDTEVRVTYQDGTPHMGQQVAIHIGGFGGHISLVLTPEQWSSIVAAVDSVLPKAAEVAS